MANEAPECFGEQWDQNAVECAGGRDPGYRGRDGSHIRERCSFFTSCGARFQAAKQEIAKPLIPASSLYRPRIEPTPTPSYTYGASSNQSEIYQLRAQLEQANKLIQQQQTSYSQGRMNGAYGTGQHPLQMMAVEMSIPKYLTVPEPINELPIWVSLGRMILRAILKAVGHTVANFADHTPIDRGHGNKPGPQ